MEGKSPANRMDDLKKAGRYSRIYKQLKDLLARTDDPLARMASICAVLHHKMDYYFWTGFYLLKDGKLVVGPYQGPVACQELETNKGVCWAALNRASPVLVEDVHDFPDHIACDSRSLSEITLPVYNKGGEIVAVFDVDSAQKASFTETDQKALSEIMALIFSTE